LLAVILHIPATPASIAVATVVVSPTVVAFAIGVLIAIFAFGRSILLAVLLTIVVPGAKALSVRDRVEALTAATETATSATPLACVSDREGIFKQGTTKKGGAEHIDKADRQSETKGNARSE
jgi:hypothetical protein